ncbi:MAG TPA: hypothetical protein GX406_07980 [Pseudoclavibacter sp.]|nr:hypothetical protein [Pseudoclavibacter sp.]
MNDVTGYSPETSHGHSPAAWTAVVVMLVGFTLGTFFFTTNQPVGVWISVAVIVLGLVAGWVMAKLGYGVRGPKYQPKEH